MRIVLFLATNIAIVIVLGIVTSLFGIDPRGQIGLLVLAFVIGFTGAIISLLLSKTTAIHSMGVALIHEPRNQDEAWLLQTIQKFSDRAGIKRPDVGIYNGAPNAFATGAFKNSALVAVSTGLLQEMTREEVEAVLGHEMSHVINGDMITMTLIQGVVNTFVVYISRLVANFVDAALSRNSDSQRGYGVAYYATVFVMEVVLGFLASIIVAWFSRYREFRADAGSAKLMGQSLSMQRALLRLEGLSHQDLPKNMASMGIAGNIGHLFSSHPPLQKRIEALQKNLY